jgi:hypothetical protein
MHGRSAIAALALAVAPAGSPPVVGAVLCALGWAALVVAELLSEGRRTVGA